MRGLTLILLLILVLIVGGALTTALSSDNGNPQSILPFLKQTEDPDASVFELNSWKAEQLLMLVLFVLFSPFPPGLIPMAIGIAALMWFLNHGVNQAKAEGGGGKAIQPATTETAVEEA